MQSSVQQNPHEFSGIFCIRKCRAPVSEVKPILGVTCASGVCTSVAVILASERSFFTGAMLATHNDGALLGGSPLPFSDEEESPSVAVDLGVYL